MTYRVQVMFDDEVVLDTTAELGEWPGYDSGGVAVALNQRGQEHPQKQLLEEALSSLADSPERDTLVRRLEALLPRDEPPVLCFSYNDPMPGKKGAVVRSNIERELPGTYFFTVSRRPNEANDVTHEYTVSVEEVS